MSESIENPIKYDYEGLISSTGSDGGAPEWESHPNPAETFNIEAGQKMKAQGNLAARKSLNDTEGSIENFTPNK